MKNTFKTFIEAAITPMEKPSESMSMEEIRKLLNTKCSNAWECYEADYRIYRGIKAGHNYPTGVYNPSTGERKSRNTSNHYTLFFDTNPANAYWPKRSKSFICSTDYDYAKVYGMVYSIFPFNNVDIGVCPSSDIWHSGFQYNGEFFDYPELNKIIAGIEQTTNTKFGSYADFERFLWGVVEGELLEVLSSGVGSGMGLADALRWDIEKGHYNHDDFVDSWLNAYAYEKNDFELVETIDNLVDADSREVWFSGNCLVIPEHHMDAIEEMMHE